MSTEARHWTVYVISDPRTRSTIESITRAGVDLLNHRDRAPFVTRGHVRLRGLCQDDLRQLRALEVVSYTEARSIWKGFCPRLGAVSTFESRLGIRLEDWLIAS